MAVNVRLSMIQTPRPTKKLRPHGRMEQIFSIPLHKAHEEAPKSIDANAAS
jgi:hypothetical protein